MPSAPPTAPIPQYPGQDFACAGAPPQPQMYPAEGIPTQAAVPGPYLPPQPGQAVYGYPVQQTMGQPIPQNMGQPVQYPMQPGQYPQYGTSGTVTYGQGGVPVYHTTTEKKVCNFL